MALYLECTELDDVEGTGESDPLPADGVELEPEIDEGGRDVTEDVGDTARGVTEPDAVELAVDGDFLILSVAWTEL